MNTIEKMNPNKTARIAGFLYVLLIPLGVFGIIYIPSSIIVTGDIVATMKNFVASESLVRLSIVTAFLTQLVNLFVVLFLYNLLRHVNQQLAALMVILILIAVPIAMINELNYIAVLVLMGSNEVLASFTPEYLQLLSMFLDLHEYGINIAGIFWGLWLLPMGVLVYKSDFIPKIIGVLLVIAVVGYLLDSFIFILNPNFGIAFSEYLFFGEIAISFWLLIRGVNVEQWEKLALKSTKL